MVPWILSVHQHAATLFGTLSAANSQLLGIVRDYPEFDQQLSALRAQWQGSSLTHGDIKWENFIVTSAGDDPAAEPTLTLVDWELADAGDPGWDAGAVLQTYLSAWILSMPAAADMPPAERVEQARYPLEAMQPAIRAFWTAYIDALAIEPKAAGALLERSVKYGAARMVQTAYEYMQYSTTISPFALVLLQVSLNALEQPRAAITDLLGLS